MTPRLKHRSCLVQQVTAKSFKDIMGFGYEFINGVSVGFEFLSGEAVAMVSEGTRGGLFIDLFILRILITF